MDIDNSSTYIVFQNIRVLDLNNLLNKVKEIICNCNLNDKQKITSFAIDGENTGNGRNNVALMLKFISKKKL